jgi:nicotinamidase-related amidase
VNAWDNPDFRAAVEATGRKQIILGGIVTEVCTLFLALSLREYVLSPFASLLARTKSNLRCRAGYSVWHNVEASGTATPRLANDANRRMEMAGVHSAGTFSIACWLMKDWRR